MEPGGISRIREQMILENRLMEVAAAGGVDGMKELISMGVNINTQSADNGWTPLHWACHRGYIEMVALLLKQGANKDICANNMETPASVCNSDQILELLRGPPLFSDVTRLQEEPDRHGSMANCLKNLQLSPSSRADYSMPTVTHSMETANIYQHCLVLKIRLANFKDTDFIEVEIPRRTTHLTYEYLQQICCNEFNLQSRQIERLRKLPNTKLRNDADVRRLRDFQEIEVVAYTNNEQVCNGALPTNNTLLPANVYQSISKKDQTILY